MAGKIDPWNGSEPITEAIVRNGLKEQFDYVIERNMRDEAIQLLVGVGATERDAVRMIDLVFAARILGGPKKRQAAVESWR